MILGHAPSKELYTPQTHHTTTTDITHKEKKKYMDFKIFKMRASLKQQIQHLGHAQIKISHSETNQHNLSTTNNTIQKIQTDPISEQRTL
jgi:hypothetical protein